MKRKIAILLCLGMVTGMLGGCGETKESSDNRIETEEQQGEKEFAKEEDTSDTKWDDREIEGIENATYLMIYNPYVYDENLGDLYQSTSLYTGDFSDQIITGMNRADNLGEDIEEQKMISQEELNKGVDLTGVNREGVRINGMDPAYELYDVHDFYRYDKSMKTSELETFTCYYVGEYCYVWGIRGEMSEDDARVMGKEFDENIYEKNVKAFGQARFTENGGKINMLFYEMEEGYGGCFTNKDIFSSTEVPENYAAQNGFNTDHAIIHLNTYYIQENPGFAMSTMSHEFQHMICSSESLYYSESPFMKSWINEAMSAYAEELVYPGIKEENYYNQFFYLSDNYRKGQSLYNFKTEGDNTIGAYGAVYLFSQYLSQLAGEDVFYNVHEYWRNSYRADVTEAQALLGSVPEEVTREIDEKYNYSSSVSAEFSNYEEEWMSKLTLDFYIATLSMKLANLEYCEDQAHAIMLYGEINPVEIEGGGRVIVALKDGTYEVPEDADADLIYIALDENFEPIELF